MFCDCRIGIGHFRGVFGLRRMERASEREGVEKSRPCERGDACGCARYVHAILREMPRREWRWEEAAGLDVFLYHAADELHERAIDGRDERRRNFLEDDQRTKTDAVVQKSPDGRAALGTGEFNPRSRSPQKHACAGAINRTVCTLHQLPYGETLSNTVNCPWRSSSRCSIMSVWASFERNQKSRK